MKKDQQFYTYGSNKESMMNAICDAFHALGIKNHHYVCNDPTSIFFSYKGEVYCAKKDDEILQWMILNNPLYKKLEVKLEPKFKIGDSIEKIGEYVTYTISNLDTKVQLYYVTDGTNQINIPFEDQDDYGLLGEYFRLYNNITDGEIYGSVEKIDRLNKCYHIKCCTKYGKSFPDFYIPFSEQKKWRHTFNISPHKLYLTGDILKFNNEYVTFHIFKDNKRERAIVYKSDNTELTVPSNLLEPVLLTDNILLQNRFKLLGTDTFVNIYKGKTFRLSKENTEKCYITNDIKIKYFHELQRLYNIIGWDRNLIL